MEGATISEQARNVATRGVCAYVEILTPITMVDYGDGDALSGPDIVTIGPCKRIAATDLYRRGATVWQMRNWTKRGAIRGIAQPHRSRIHA